MARKKAETKEKPEKVIDIKTRTQGGAVERIGGEDAEIMPERLRADGLPDDITDRIDNAIYDFMTYQCTPPLEDMAKARQARWSACCMYIGETVFKKGGIARRAEREENGKWIGIDAKIIDAIIPLWLFYCSKYEKTPLKADFVYFSGVSLSWLYTHDRESVTPERVKVLQKLGDIQEHGIKGIITDGRSNPTGNIVILNHDHGYATSNVVVQHEVKQAISAVQLPKLSDNSQPGQ